ncbi:MAG: Nitric oxide reductase FlRd-NAD(+) reductase [Phycisphaerales bacterium]|nr:Nitric oxide reductase FlRd-NAD(+) reductase [Phycisphaerales bacterium]
MTRGRLNRTSSAVARRQPSACSLPFPVPPRVVIIGGGFAGLAAARALASAPVEVILIDRRNHHVFQPLLYQVATAALSPADIASPIRRVLRNVKNCRVVLAEPTSIDLHNRQVVFPDDYRVAYDWLVLAAGATHSYFGHDDWAAVAPGLKTLEDATELRRRILLAFESAEYEGNEDARRAALTFAIVGGGPTGVELAGAIKEIAAKTIPADFRFIDTTTTRVILVEGEPRLLSAFPPELSERARRDLASMGVEVRLNTRVTDVSRDGVKAGDEFIPARTVFWAAGVRGSPLGATLGVPLDRTGRVIVKPDLSIPGHPEAFVVGDLAAAYSADTNQPVPGVAQGALQSGRYVGRLIARETSFGQGPHARPEPVARDPFIYRDKGSMATIGRAKAVAWIRGMKFGGFLAWLLWGGIHVMFLVSFRNRLFVLATWAWNWFFFSRDARLIVGDSRIDLRSPRTAEPPSRDPPAELAGGTTPAA